MCTKREGSIDHKEVKCYCEKILIQNLIMIFIDIVLVVMLLADILRPIINKVLDNPWKKFCFRIPKLTGSPVPLKPG